MQSAKTRPGPDCGSDHKHLIAKFGLKFKKVGKTTRPFRYDLNQIPYDYPVDVCNLMSGSSAFSKTTLNIWIFTVHILLKPGLENFKHYFISV